MLLGARQFFAARKAEPAPALPYDAEVEYLESTGTQWIDTGIYPSRSIGAKVDFASVNDGGDQCILMAGSDSWRWGISFRVGYWLQISGLCVSGVSWTNYDVLAVGVRGVVSYNWKSDLTAYYNASLLRNPIPTGDVTSPGSIWLFGSNYNGSGTLWRGASMKCYGCEMSDGNNVIRDFIPVRFTNELGNSEGAMYDRVSGQLFRNQGTGAFTIGPDKTSWTNPYVTDGLVAMWDGEWNAGHENHQSSATSWVDLVGSNALTIDSRFASWGANCLVLSGADISNESDWGAVGLSPIAGIKTLEIHGKFPSSLLRGHSAIASGTSGRGLGGFGGGWITSAVDRSLADNSRFWSGVTPATMFGVCFTYQSDIDNENVSFYRNGSLYTGTTTIYGSPEHAANVAKFKSVDALELCAVRGYSRALTAAEIAANYEIDKARFNLP